MPDTAKLLVSQLLRFERPFYKHSPFSFDHYRITRPFGTVSDACKDHCHPPAMLTERSEGQVSDAVEFLQKAEMQVANPKVKGKERV